MELKLKHVRGYRQFLRKTSGILAKNPILVCGLALPLAVVPSTGLVSATALVLSMFAAYFPVLILAAVLGEKLNLCFRVTIYPLCSALVLIPVRMLIRAISPTTLESLGVYFSLICVSSMIIAGAEFAAKNRKLLSVMRFGLFNWLGFSLVILSCAFVRELIGSGTLWGVPISWVKFPVPGMLMAFMGFLVLGFMAAFCRMIHRIITFIQLKTPGKAQSVMLDAIPNVEDITPEQRHWQKQKERRVR